MEGEVRNKQSIKSSITSEFDYTGAMSEGSATYGLDRYFNNVLSIVSAAAVLLLLYLNFRMFETYIGEFMFAFVFSEALWDTKRTFICWFETVHSLAAVEENQFSLRKELLTKIQQWLSIFNPKVIVQLQKDISGAYIQAGVLITALVIKPSLCLSVGLIFLGILLLVIVLNNRLLFIFRLHIYLGVSNNTLVASFIVLGLVCVSALLTLAFGILISRDISLLRQETSAFLAREVHNESSFIYKFVQDSITAAKPYIEQNNNFIDSHLEDMPGVRLVVHDVLNYLHFSMEEKEVIDVEEDVCSVQFESGFKGFGKYLSCLQTDLMNLPWRSFLPSLTGLMFQGTNIVTMATRLALVLMDIGFRLIFFITILFLLLNSKETALESFLKTFTVAHSDEEHLLMTFEREMQRSMEAILIIPTRMSLLNAMATIIVMLIFDLNARYLCASAVFFFSMFPLVVPCCMIIPWLLFYIAAYDMTWARACFIFLFHFVCHYIVQNWALIGFSQVNIKRIDEDQTISEENIQTTSTGGGKTEYVTTLTIFFGMVTFGGKGILIGPFLFCLVTISQKVYLKYKALSHPSMEGRKSRSSNKTNSTRYLSPQNDSFVEDEDISKENESETSVESVESLKIEEVPKIEKATLVPDTKNALTLELSSEQHLLRRASSWYDGSEENIAAIARGFAKIRGNSPTLKKSFFPRRINEVDSRKYQMPSATQELQQAFSLYEKGGLTKEEYDAVKKSLLSKIIK